MKQRVLKKKLALNKSTIADLDSSRMNAVRGGDSTNPGCPTVTCGTCDDLACGDSTNCFTDETGISACYCISVELPCPG